MNWLLAHFIGDYILQNDWMAKGKKQNSWICFIHVVFYMVPFIFVEISVIQFALIGLQHFLQDRSSFIKWFCKVTDKFQSENKTDFKGLPWGHFIVDNIFHLIWIMAIMTYIK